MPQGQPPRLAKSIDALSGDVVFTLRVPAPRAQTLEAILRQLLALAQPSEEAGAAAAPDAPEAAAWHYAQQMGYPYPCGMPAPGYPPYPGFPPPYGYVGYPPVGYPANPAASPQEPRPAPGQPAMSYSESALRGSCASAAAAVAEPALSPEPGKRLRRLRRSRGLTQKALSEMIQTTQSRISEFEAGVRAIPLSCAEVLAQLFGVSADEFLDE